MSKYRELLINPPKLKLEGKPREIKINLIDRKGNPFVPKGALTNQISSSKFFFLIQTKFSSNLIFVQ